MDDAVALPSSSSTSVITTVAPSWTNRAASSAPWPRAPPVTNATLPLSLCPCAMEADARSHEGRRALDVLVGDLEEQPVEDEELGHPDDAEPDDVADVRQDRAVGVLVLEDDDDDRGEHEAEEAQHPERDDLGVE